ncbi:MAG: Mobile element protein [Labilithrix sp.]|nr:Mobile element protein [Labilithrix sp.]
MGPPVVTGIVVALATRSSKVRDVLVRWSAGAGVRAIARETLLDRKTVRRYLAVLAAMRRERWMPVDDDVVAAVEAVVRRAPARSRLALRVLEAQRARIRRYLGAGLTLAAVHDALEQRGVRVSYATLRRYAIDELGWASRPALTG